MFARLSRSWNLLKASAGILRQDKQLVVFPLVSAAAMLMVFASFAVPVVGLGVHRLGLGIGVGFYLGIDLVIYDTLFPDYHEFGGGEYVPPK